MRRDSVYAGVAVSARSGAPSAGQGSISPENVTLRDSAIHETQIGVPSSEVRWHFAVSPTDTAGSRVGFRFDASSAAGADAVKVSLPVQPAHVPRSHTIAGVVRGTSRVTFELPPDVDPARSHLSLLIRAVRVSALLTAVTAVAVLACALGAWPQVHVPRGSVTGQAAAAVGDSGIFAPPTLPRAAPGRSCHSQNTSASVPRAHRGTMVFRDRRLGYPTVPYEPGIRRDRAPRMRTRVLSSPNAGDAGCERREDHEYEPSDNVAAAVGNSRMRRFGPRARLGLLAGRPTRGAGHPGPGPTDVPELEADLETAPHIGRDARFSSADWERGIKPTPETAVATVAAVLGPTGARVAEVPAAFAGGEKFGPEDVFEHPGPKRTLFIQLVAQPLSRRWRLTLDRAVTLHGTASRQVVRTRTST